MTEKKTNEKRLRVEDVFKALDSTEFMIGSRPGFFGKEDQEYVVIYERQACEEHGMHVMKRLYHILPDGYLEELPVKKMMEEVKKAIRDKVNVDELLEQALLCGGPSTLVKVHSILQKHPEVKDKITSKPGCLFLNVPNPEMGEPDEPVYLRL